VLELFSWSVIIKTHTHNTYGDGCFAAAGPLVWNSLPAELRQCHSLEQFKRHLKTHFFHLWDHGTLWLFSKTAPHRNSLTYLLT